MRGITLNLHFAVWFREDWQFGEVRKDQCESERLFQRFLIAESTLHHTDGIEFVGAIHAIDIEFSLIEALKRSLQEEGLTVRTTGKVKK
jgi:hypothetical protein